MQDYEVDWPRTIKLRAILSEIDLNWWSEGPIAEAWIEWDKIYSEDDLVVGFVGQSEGIYGIFDVEDFYLVRAHPAEIATILVLKQLDHYDS